MPPKRERHGPLYPADLLQSPLYSRTCKAGLRVMERLAAAAGRPGSLRKPAALAVETRLPAPDLEQVLGFLQIAGLLEAPPGSGGVRLSRPASRISLLQVVRAIDGAGLWSRCILGLEECSDTIPCPAHEVWKQTRVMLEQHLDRQSLADLTLAVTRRRRARRGPATRPGQTPEGR